MITPNDIARTAGLIGEPARTRMLLVLLDGRAHTAGELARAAGITAPTASRHLALLVDGGLVGATTLGRHRYHHLASAEVAAIVESLMQLAAAGAGAAARPPVTGPRDAAMRRARTCYDHLAGRLGVAVAEHLAQAGAIELAWGRAAATDRLARELARIDLELPVATRADSRRIACRACMDWSERRPHLAGPLATMLCSHLLQKDWLRRQRDGRALEITSSGAQRLGGWLGAERWSGVVSPSRVSGR